jgi:hypothetical protein
VSDLSRLLDDVYGPTGAGAAPAKPAATPPGETGLPDWAMESVMDDPFGEWVPGVTADPAAAAPTSLDEVDLAAGVDQDLDAAVEVRAWDRSDDDILPTRRSWSASRGRRSAVAPTPTLVLAGAQGDEEPATAGRRFLRRRG